MLVFNKVDAIPEPGILEALKAQHDHVAFVSALRGIGLDALRQAILRRIEDDFVEQVAFVPVRESKALAYLHEVADVLSEDYVFAHDGDEGHEAEAVARVRFRVARRHMRDLTSMLRRYEAFTPV
jgi:GTP-binding protein HflX